MKRLFLLTMSVAVLTVLASPAAFAQGTPDEETPANEGVCDGLIGFTPGLYGLCVAFCEAQDCDATFDPATNEVVFDPSCRPSSPKLLKNYNRRANPGDPPMPCVIVLEDECPCWTSEEISALGTQPPMGCFQELPGDFAALFGLEANGHNSQAFSCTPPRCPYDQCFYQNQAPGPPGIIRFQQLTPEEAAVCIQSLVDECAARGF